VSKEAEAAESGAAGEGDRYLAARLREGDEEAFRQIIDRFTGRLRAYAARRLPAGSTEVEDVLQDTFLGLLVNAARLGEIRSLEAFLFSILRHKLIDAARRGPRARGLVPLDAGESGAGREYAAPGATPSHHAKQEETTAIRRKVLADILAEALGGLKAEKRFRDLKVLELLFYCGWKGKDAAAAAATSEPTVTRIRTETLERLARLARRHPQSDPSLASFGPDEDPAGLVGDVWRENLLSCLKRSTLGAHALGVLEADWEDYVKFHLETVRCEACAANLEDIAAGTETTRSAREKIFASSVGFLRTRHPKK
jgi:RNA polymerase sigma factor (sigma-70 family)